MTSETADIITDYLVIGAGVGGLSFTDDLLTHSSADTTITIVDKRDAPGGHWNDSYPFVKLHGPSVIYGVNSTPFADTTIEQNGPNKGFLNLASGPEVLAYCSRVMKDRLLPSGRVTYLPSTEYLEDEGILRAVLNPNKRLTVRVNKRLVNARYTDNVIPLTHTRSFRTAPSVTCIPPNELPRLAPSFPYVTVLGAGKTGIDACIWLLSNGLDPSRLRWIIPNDYWYSNRATLQVAPQFFNQVLSATADRFEAIAKAESATDLAHRLEARGYWHRLDTNVEPPNFHAAVVSKDELAELRKIKDVVRQGHVTALDVDKIVLTRGTASAQRDTLYVDCTASAIPRRPLIPIYQPGRITLQLIFSPMASSSAAVAGFIETLDLTDEERNELVRPLTWSRTVDEYIHEIMADMMNRYNLSKNPDTRRWISTSRLDGFGPLVVAMQPFDKEQLAIMARLREGIKETAMNLPRLLAALKTRPHL